MSKLLSMLSMVTILSAGELHWSNDYNQTIKEAQKEHKDVLMMYHASWCPECSYMKEVVFKDPRLSAYMESHYKLLAFDITKDKKRLPKGYSFVGVPTFFFIAPDGKQIAQFEGSGDAPEFLKKLQSIKP